MIRHIEELSINAWPALQTVMHDGWLIRFSNGYTKRANSINPLYDSTDDMYGKIQYCESLFHARGLRPTFKMTLSVHPDNLDVVLASLGYKAIDHTSVQSVDLSRSAEPLLRTVKLEEELSEPWLDQFCLLSHQEDTNRATMRRMFGFIVPKTCFISLLQDECVVACGVGILERGYLGLFDVVTDERFRNRGFGEQLILNLLKWGRENGARHSYLQVMRSNAPALKLYSKLGFREIYHYWYRFK